jgi:SAM-dependent methyltransferase
MNNIDPNTVKSFGDEWSRFDQSSMPEEEGLERFEEYFGIFPWKDLPENSEGFDMGCGSGRWAKYVAPRVGQLHCIDPSEAIEVAKKSLTKFTNVYFHRTSVDQQCLPLSSQDFGYSLGVLHHVPDTKAAITSCADLLKSGAPLLLYLYYSFENRSLWFRLIWRCSDLLRRVIHRLPHGLKQLLTDLIAILVYWPLVTLSRVLEYFGFDVSGIPLSYYRNCSFYTMRTDARDRFGTPLERRFTREQITAMMESSGLVNIKFSDRAPYWSVVGFKR